MWLEAVTSTTLGRLLFILADIIVMIVVCSFAASAQGTVDTIPRPSNDDVSLRDYTSSRIDHLQQVMDERDRQYAQRFEAQQQALNAALQAAKEAVANALSAAKEAVTKAEEASNKRFDSVNEFRQTLTDQASTFMSKAEADARLKAVEDDISRIASRSEGANNLWLVIGGLIVIGFAAASFALNLSKRKETS